MHQARLLSKTINDSNNMNKVQLAESKLQTQTVGAQFIGLFIRMMCARGTMNPRQRFSREIYFRVNSQSDWLVHDNVRKCETGREAQAQTRKEKKG